MIEPRMMVTSGVLSYSDSRMLTKCAFYCMRYFVRQKHAYNPSHFPKREKETSEMDATNKTVTVKRVNVRYLTVTAMLSAVAYIWIFPCRLCRHLSRWISQNFRH